MKIEPIQNERFTKSWYTKNSENNTQKSDTQQTKIVKGDYFLRSKHNYTDKATVKPNDKKVKFTGFPRPIFTGDLKKAWTNKEIPLVTRGFFGDKLTFDNVGIKTIAKDCVVLVGNKKSGDLDDKSVVAYFLQFVSYPKYRKYILDTLKRLDNVRSFNE